MYLIWEVGTYAKVFVWGILRQFPEIILSITLMLPCRCQDALLKESVDKLLGFTCECAKPKSKV